MWRPVGLWNVEAPAFLWKIDSQMAVRSSLSSGHPLRPGRFPVIMFPNLLIYIIGAFWRSEVIYPVQRRFYRLDDREVAVWVLVRSRIFTSPYHPNRLWCPPASYPMGTGALSLELKWQGCGANHSPPTSAKVKKTWICTSTPPCVFMA
jgi:hypothetical protein